MAKKFIKKNKVIFCAKIIKVNGDLISKRSSKKIKIYNFPQANSLKFKLIYIKVTYKQGIYNDGEYTYKQKNDLFIAWRSFTEENFIKGVINYY